MPTTHPEMMQDLITHLVAVYCRPGVADDGSLNGPSAWDQHRPKIAGDSAATALAHFFKFARDYLEKNPPITSIYLAEGLGLQLADGVEVSFSAGHVAGMEPAGDVPITRGDTARGKHGVVPDASVPVTGARS